MKFKNKKLTLITRLSNCFWGSFWIILSIIVFISIYSHDKNDISFNTVSTNPKVSNFLGEFGACLSDLILQILGYSSIIFIFIFLVLGIKIIFNNVIYNKIQKTIAFIFSLISSSVMYQLIFSNIKCNFNYCENIFGNFIIDNFYYIPQSVLFSICLIAFFISISFILDINKRWWIFYSTKLFRFLKKLIFSFFGLISLIFKLITTKNFRAKVKMFFMNIFYGEDNDFILIDEEQEQQNNQMNNENIIDNEDKKITSNNNKKSIFKLFKKNERNKEILDNIVEESKYIFNKIQVKESSTINMYNLPNTNLLDKNLNKSKFSISKEELMLQSSKLINVLKDFGVVGDMISVKAGPIITLHEFEPSAGTKSSRIIGLSDDIARSMSSVSARISVIPGKNAMGIELPNKKRETIYIKDLLESSEYRNSKYPLPIIIGSDIAGDSIIADLSKMPHLLVAGTTGSGKSVAINTMVMSLIFKMTPDQCKFIMVDPKMLELSVYDGIPHLLTPVVTEPMKAVAVLKWVCREMEDRYRIMASLGVRNIAGYNDKLNLAIKNGTKLTRKVQVGFDSETDEPIYEEKEIEEKEMPYIVVIVDEMADLMITAGKEIEASIQRIAQKARAAGIHLIMATQRPSVDVITGVIKANFPTRMSFQVVSKIDSRTILGEQGAEQLLGMGDMLFMSGGGKIIRAHGPFVSDNEVEKIVTYIKSQGFKPNYVNDILKNNEEFNNDENDQGIANNSQGDDLLTFNQSEKDLYKQALNIVKNERKCSISYIQRSLRIGYNKAANLVEEMERNGILSSPNNMGKREILIKKE